VFLANIHKIERLNSSLAGSTQVSDCTVHASKRTDLSSLQETNQLETKHSNNPRL
jgi:hypothetical protein